MDQPRLFQALRERIEPLEVIDTHEHTVGPSSYPQYREPIQALIQGYVEGDLISAGGLREMEMLRDPAVPTDKKWPAFERFWKRTEHTGYARVTKWVLREMYGVTELTRESLDQVGERLLDFSDPAKYEAFLQQHRIRCRLIDLPRWANPALFPGLLDGKYQAAAYDRIMIGLPPYHAVRTYDAVAAIVQHSRRTVTSLDEYLDVCRGQFQELIKRGAVGFKDQSAYLRTLAYAHPPRADAERLFNEMMRDPRRDLGWPAAQPLDDYLFHEFLRMARELDVPVQIHTGHMAGTWNEITKTNAALFTPVLELHREVRFDLFHGNWPYAGEWLFLGKNYPNASLDCCWLHIIDPRYARRVLADALVTVPHAKIHGFGGDYLDCIEYAAGHLAIAKDNIAAALADMVAAGWLDTEAAAQVAADWLFNNANEFFRLGFEPVRP